MDKKLTLELKRPKFDRSRLRVYYGNMGEIIAQQVLRKQGFEVWLTRPVGNEDFIRVLTVPKMDEELKGLRRHYDNFPSFRKREETWEEFLNKHKEHIRYEIKWVKANRAFFGEQLDAFITYLKKLKREYSPDLIAKKDGKIYVIEVKSRKGAIQFLKGKKLRGLLLAREYGFIPSLVSFNLKIEAENFKMEAISE